MAATSYFQSSQMMSRNPAAANNPQARLMRFAPLVFVLFCIRFPAGVVLYYTVSNICRIVQQDLMYRFDPKVKALVAQEVVEVEELTHEIDDRKAGRNGAGKPTAKPETGGRQSFREMWAQASGQQLPPRRPSPRGATAAQAPDSCEGPDPCKDPATCQEPDPSQSPDPSQRPAHPDPLGDEKPADQGSAGQSPGGEQKPAS